MRTALFALAGILVTVLMAGAFFLHFNPLCGEDLIAEESSPDGRYVAVLVERGCGATTPFIEHINLRSPSSRFRPNFFDGTITQGEIFTLDSRKHEGSVRFDWVGPRRMKIVYPSGGQFFRHQNIWQDVHIEYPFQRP